MTKPATTSSAHLNSRRPNELEMTVAPPAYGADVTPATTFSFKITRGMKGAFGFEMDVHHARTPGEAVHFMQGMLRTAMANLPELTRLE